MRPRISVVVCTKNSERTLNLTLSSISRLKPSEPFEIIIIDGGSKDKTIEIAKKYTKRIYYDNGKGLAYARQMGAMLARGDYVLYLDSDVEINDLLFFEKLLDEMKIRNWIAVHAAVKQPVNNSFWENGMDFYFSRKFNIPGEKDYLPMMACLIRRDVLLTVGFDMDFKGAGEDHDFWERVRLEGYKFGVCREAKVIHHHRSSFKEFVKQRIWYGKGNILLFKKYKNWLRLLNPFGTVVSGILLSLCSGRLRLLFFFMIWGLSLGTGELLGILDLVNLRKSDGKN